MLIKYFVKRVKKKNLITEKLAIDIELALSNTDRLAGYPVPPCESC